MHLASQLTLTQINQDRPYQIAFNLKNVRAKSQILCSSAYQNYLS